MQPVIHSRFGIIAVAERAGRPAPVIGVSKRQVIVERGHSQRNAHHWVRLGSGNGLIVLHPLPAAVGIRGFHHAGISRVRMGEAVGAVRGDERIDEVAAGIVIKLRRQADDVGDFAEPAGRVILERRKPPERIRHLRDFVNVVRFAVRQRRDLADGVGDGDQTKAGVIRQRERIAKWIHDLREKNFARGADGAVRLAEDQFRAVPPKHLIAVRSDASEQRLVILLEGEGLRAGVERGERPRAAAPHVAIHIYQKIRRVVRDVRNPIARPLRPEV